MTNMDGTTLEIIHRVHELFKARDLTLSLAESCTGGLISHYITHLPGASAFFTAGVVSYSAEMKIKILGVSSDIISSYGVVSEQTAREMAEKTRSLTDTDFSVSTTGNLGPDVLEGRETGLIYVAVSKKGRTFAKELRLRGKREENKEEAVLEALKFLIEIAQG
jgi:PncC family amidohydrolase